MTMIPVPEDVLVNAVEKVSKSVVNIASVRMLHDQMFRIFPIEGVGSGIVINENGYILTNNHVIDDAERLKVTLSDGSVLRGKVVGSDETTDLAVLKVESNQSPKKPKLKIKKLRLSLRKIPKSTSSSSKVSQFPF